MKEQKDKKPVTYATETDLTRSIFNDKIIRQININSISHKNLVQTYVIFSKLEWIDFHYQKHNQQLSRSYTKLEHYLIQLKSELKKEMLKEDVHLSSRNPVSQQLKDKINQFITLYDICDFEDLVFELEKLAK